MNDIYMEVSLFFRPLTAENILSINAKFCAEDGFLPNQRSIHEIEPKLFSAYYYCLSKIYEKSPINDDLIQSLIPEVAGIICYYIASTQMFPTANKRTAASSAELFLYANGFGLKYKEMKSEGSNELVDLLRGIGNNDFNKAKTIEWFQGHTE